MQDELIQFETAKLAKEKGFNELCYDYYDELKELEEFASDSPMKPRNNQDDSNKNFIILATAPTQSLLQRWLIEEHNIAVLLSFNDNTVDYYYYFIHSNIKKACSNRICSLGLSGKSGVFKTYEEALEEGLQQALKLIKN